MNNELKEQIIHDIQSIIQKYIYDRNSNITRSKIQAECIQYLSSLKISNKIYDFTSRCDETLNTSEVIDRNELKYQFSVKENKFDDIIEIELTFKPIKAELEDVL